MKVLPLLFAMALALPSAAQVRIDAPIQLDGAAAADRRVMGIGAAPEGSAALSADLLREGPYRYAVLEEGAGWSVAFTPAITALLPGTTLFLRSAEGNAGPVQLQVDGLGTYPVYKGAEVELGPGDISAAAVVHVVFDGSAFQLVSGRRTARRPCPAGSVAVGGEYCIDVQQRPHTGFDTASVVCGELNGQLCTWGQWYAACTRATELGLVGMVGDWEWTNSAANADGSVRVVGQSSCTHAAVGTAFSAPTRAVRCCYRR